MYSWARFGVLLSEIQQTQYFFFFFFLSVSLHLEILKDGEGRTAAAAAASAVQKRRESCGGHLQSARRGAAEVGQRRAGAAAAEGRGGEEGRHRGAREPNAGSEPATPAAPERNT